MGEMTAQKMNGPGVTGARETCVVQSTLSTLSIGSTAAVVKLLGEIISAFSPQNDFSLPI
jgi:hypothetical protein